jgi:intraflagellar transport protein 74
MAREGKLPTQGQVTEMKDDLKFKQDQMENSETTAARLSVQKDQINQDLDKVKNLEGRIKKEMEQAENKIDSMNTDINQKFKNTDNLKTQFEDEKHRMTKIG